MFVFASFLTSGGARGWQEGAEPPPERFEPPLESFETRIEIRKSYVMSALLGAQPPPEYFLGAEPPPRTFFWLRHCFLRETVTISYQYPCRTT